MAFELNLICKICFWKTSWTRTNFVETAKAEIYQNVKNKLTKNSSWLMTSTTKELSTEKRIKQ